MSNWISTSCLCVITVFVLCDLVSGECRIPYYLRGDWYGMVEGHDVSYLVTKHAWADTTCEDIHVYNTTSTQDGYNVTLILKKKTNGWLKTSDCYVCVDVLWRTGNVIQITKSHCFARNSGFENMCIHGFLPVDRFTTLFRQTLMSTNCASTFGGVYQFSYEDAYSLSRVCDNPNSTIIACQPPGSPYIDNETFLIYYKKCPSVGTSVDRVQRYQCMGSWFAMIGEFGYTFAAIADTVEKDRRERFKCLITDRNQKSADHTIRWVMSHYADCSKLTSIKDGPIRLGLKWDRQKTTEICN